MHATYYYALALGISRGGGRKRGILRADSYAYFCAMCLFHFPILVKDGVRELDVHDIKINLNNYYWPTIITVTVAKEMEVPKSTPNNVQ